MEDKNIQRVINKYIKVCERLVEDNIYVDYTNLQRTWNTDVLKYSLKWLPECNGIMHTQKLDRAICLGTFVGACEMALSNIFELVVAVDHEDFMPDWHPENILFHQADLDSWNWELPEARYDVCYMVEILEHLMWSPISLLKWIHNHCNMLVITTPDDSEWPSMDLKGFKRFQHFSCIPSATPGTQGNPEPMNHVKQYKQEEFVQLLAENGFRVVEMQRVGSGGHQIMIICTPR